MLNKIKIVIDGKEKTIKLDELQLEALRKFRQEYRSTTLPDLQTFTKGMQFLIEEMIKK